MVRKLIREKFLQLKVYITEVFTIFKSSTEWSTEKQSGGKFDLAAFQFDV